MSILINLARGTQTNFGSQDYNMKTQAPNALEWFGKADGRDMLLRWTGGLRAIIVHDSASDCLIFSAEARAKIIATFLWSVEKPGVKSETRNKWIFLKTKIWVGINILQYTGNFIELS